MSNSVLVDLNNLAIRNFFTKDINPSSDDPEYKLWKYNIFSQVYNYIFKFKPVKEIILAVDGNDSWRKLFFNRYKESRKNKRQDDIDWDSLYKEFIDFHNQIKNNIPIKVIKINRAEADDVIGVLANYIKNNVIVISNDCDYVQLCNKKISVWNPSKKEYSKLTESKDKFLSRLYLKGQSKDDIFNVKTPDDYPKELRKPPMGDKMVDKIFENQGLENFLNEEITIDKEYEDENGEKVEYKKTFTPKENYRRNKILISFDMIPQVVKDTIIKQYDRYKLPEPENIYTFFKDNDWTEFLEKYDLTEKTLLNMY